MENKVTADYVDEEGCLHCGICATSTWYPEDM